MIARSFLRNVTSSYLATFISLGIAFFFTPYVIERLGKTEYGLWALVLSIIAFMEIADLGMRQSLLRFASRYFAREDWQQVSKVLSTSVVIYAGIAIIVEAATLIIAFYLLPYWQIPGDYLSLARAVLLVIGTNQAISFFLIPFASLGPYHRFDINTYVAIVGKLAQTVAIVFLLETGFGLLQMAVAVLVTSLVQRLAAHLVRTRLFPGARISPRLFDRDQSKELLSYARYSFLIVVTSLIIFQIGNIVSGRYLSLEAVTIFSIAAAIIAQLRGLVQNIAVPLVPAISHLDSLDHRSRIVEVYLRVSRYLYFVAGYMAIMIFIFSGPFIRLWLGAGFDESSELLKIMIIPAAIYFPQITATSVLYGTSRHQVALYVLALEAVSIIALAVALAQKWGLQGIAVGIALPQLLIYLFIYPVAFHRAMNTASGPFYREAGRSVVLSVLIVLPVALICDWMLDPADWLQLIVCVVVTSAAAIVSFTKSVLLGEDEQRLVTMFRRQSSDK